VTGGAGFIGSHIVDRLIDDGYAVTVLDNFSTGRRALIHPSADVVRCDLRSRALSDGVARIRPDVVVHAAAQASVPRSIAEPLEDAAINVLGTVKLLEACMSPRLRAFVYISTGGAAYGDTRVLPTPDDAPLRPLSPYGISKVSAERYVDAIAALRGVRAVTLRLANVYGPRQNVQGEAGVVAIFASQLSRGADCMVTGDGQQTRDFVYVLDVADAVGRAIALPEAAGAMNIGTGIETTIQALYMTLAGFAGVDRPATPVPARPGEARRSALLPERAQKVLGWTPSTSLDVGLKATLEYFARGDSGR
jgi:UDP-glucose 4-epimerase